MATQLPTISMLFEPHLEHRLKLETRNPSMNVCLTFGHCRELERAITVSWWEVPLHKVVDFYGAAECHGSATVSSRPGNAVDGTSGSDPCCTGTTRPLTRLTFTSFRPVDSNRFGRFSTAPALERTRPTPICRRRSSRAARDSKSSLEASRQTGPWHFHRGQRKRGAASTATTWSEDTVEATGLERLAVLVRT
jgi:hypothetical protein